jgi:SAM-dependent methyltransferase
VKWKRLRDDVVRAFISEGDESEHMANPTPMISQRVDNYILHRPRYPRAILDLLRARCGLEPRHTIADIGSGPGILTELFLEHGHRVLGVEPDPDMRAGAAYYLRDFSSFRSVAGTAEETTLSDRSVDFVTVGQAFHWFDLERARDEFRRILRIDGWVVLVWNIQKAVGKPFLEALQGFWETEQFWKVTSPQTREQMARAQAYRLDEELAREELLDPFFGEGRYEQVSFDNPVIYDFQGLKGRILSNGPALEPGDPNYEPMLTALEDLFQTHQINGTVTIEHDTRVVYGKPGTKEEGDPKHAVP